MNLGTPIATGNTAEVYRCDNRAIKVFQDHLPGTEAEKEAWKQQLAYVNGLPVPEVLEVTEVAGRPAIIMEYIEGTTLGELLCNNKREAEFYMNLSVEMQRTIHQVKADSIESMREKLIRQIESAPLVDDRQKSGLIKTLQAISYDPRLCHGDFHLFNLMKLEDKVTIIDWVDASTGDIRADVYRTYLLYSQFSEEWADLYLRLYCEQSGLQREEIFQWGPIIAAARLSEEVASENPERLLKIIKSFQ